MTCGAANGYLCLSLCYEKRFGHILVAWGSLLKLRNITYFSLWENFTSNFPYLAKFIGKKMSTAGRFLFGHLL